MLKFKHVKNKKSISKRLKRFLVLNNLSSIYTALEADKTSKNYFDFSVSDRSKISYLRGDRVPQYSHLYYNNAYRKSKAFHTSIGKLVADSNVSQAEIQKASALLQYQNSKIIITDKIQYYYHENNYSKLSGNLGNSCMRHDSLQDAIKLYEIIGKGIVQLAVILDSDDKVLARGLLWYTARDNDNNNIIYLDRVYGVDDNYQTKLYDWAEQKGYKHYKNNSNHLSIKVSIDNNIPLPYMDTFRYYNYDGYLNNNDGDVCLESTDARTIEELDDNYECEHCHNTVSRNEILYIDDYGIYLCDGCWVYSEDEQRHIPEKYAIEINGEYYSEDNENICYSDYDSQYYLIDDCVYSEYHNSYLACQDVVFCESDDDYYFINDTCIIEIDGKYYLKNDENIIYDDITDVYQLA
jgi:hypothetical protein